MRSFLEVLRFEIRYQLKAPFLWGALLVFFLIHFLTVTSIGIHLDENQRIDVNGAAKIIQVVSTLNYLAMLPVVVLVVTAITRDYDKSLVSFFFVTPIGKLPFLLGRFTGAYCAALALGLVCLLGTAIGTYMPWLDRELLGSYTWAPYVFSLVVIVLPNLFIMCALFFAVAALTRSVAMTAAAAMTIMTADLVLALYTGLDDIGPAAIADPFAALTIREATRYWTVPELNTQLPGGHLLVNRLLWLGIASLSLVFALTRFRLDLAYDGGGRWWPFHRQTRPKAPPAPLARHVDVEPRFLCWDSLAQFASQLKMDVAGALKNPFTLVLVVLAAVTTIQEFRSHADPLSGLPYYPLTSLMLGHFRYGLVTFVIIVAIYYSGALVYREKESGVSEIVGASPYADWIMVVSKTVALCLVVIALLLTAMLTSMASQALAAYTNFEIPVYLRSLFVHNGPYYAMLCVLAVALQVLAPNKWLGTLAVFAAFVILLSLEQIGVEHILVSFLIPYAVYSDMNGYGPAGPQVVALIAYWSPFCVLLMVVGNLLYPRGLHASLSDRAREAATRFGRGVGYTALGAAAAFVAAGGWIFYNTNILNRYQTTAERQQLLAKYEIDYGRYVGSPAPSFQQIDLAVDVYPQERRLESRGSALLRNNKDHAINEFVVSVEPQMEVMKLAVGSATLTTSDSEQGFYLFAMSSPLEPGMTVTLNWDMKRQNRGFVSKDHDYEIVENGTYLPTPTMPIPGFDSERFITSDDWRRRLGLDPAKGLPELGDPAYLGVLKFGVDSHTEFRAVLSTSADQIAVTQGELQREWLKDGRRYFEYVADRPIWPAISFSSAGYEVARDKWNDVTLEIYHDKKHGMNIEAMLKTVKLSLDYLTREFAPYPHATFKIVEHPLYHLAAHPPPGTADYPEVLGFLTDNSSFQGLDFATIHELSHQWWGCMAYGARMRGRQMLNETLAQYSTLMIFKEYFGPSFAGRVARSFQDGYLKSRRAETDAERPLIETDDQGYISYFKGPLAFYALADAIGEGRVNRALRKYLEKFADKGPPFPTSRDVVNELRAVAGDEHQELITDLFEKIVLYDFRIDQVDVRRSGDVFDVSITLAARKFEVDGLGEETEVPLNADVDVALFSQADDRAERRLPAHQEKRRVHSGIQTITLQVTNPPKSVEIDPLYMMIDRTRQDSVMKIDR
ncbi:MAG: M1 family aminopeptidase [Pirellulales bacterium]